MRFSIIIPVFNVAEYLPACMDSVLSQDFSDYEIILSEDSSTDGVSGAMCDRYAAENPGTVRVIHRPNSGAGAARNAAIDIARGEYLLFPDGDDTLAPGSLRRLDDTLAVSRADVCFYGAVVTDGERVTRTYSPSPALCGRVLTLGEAPEMLLGWTAAWCAVWRRRLFLENDIRFLPRGWGEDLYMTRRMIARADRIFMIPDVIYSYLQRRGSYTNTATAARGAEIMRTFDALLDWYRDSGLFEKYRDELARLTVDHVLIAASVRVAMADPRSPLLREFAAYTSRRFPDYMQNPYMRELPRSHRLIVRLLRRGNYALIRALFRLKSAF